MDQPEILPGAAARPGPDLPGPFAVGRYANKLKDWMRERPRVLLIGEVTGVGRRPMKSFLHPNGRDE